MIELLIIIVIAWLVFSTFLVVIVCMNSERISRLERGE